MWRSHLSGMVARRSEVQRLVTGLALVCALLAVQLYLYSPWHHRPAQGRQYCSFFPLEQGNVLEVSGPIVFVPPISRHHVVEEKYIQGAAALPLLQQGSRAPPA
ncbi:MAG: hypothetical protein ACE141_04110 [Bryobacteraceae bacterium]